MCCSRPAARPGRLPSRASAPTPTDARVLYELDQLGKRMGQAPAARLRDPRERSATAGAAARRPDRRVRDAAQRVGRYREAVAVLAARRFHPWEGGEGLVSRQWVVAHRELARASAPRWRRPAAADLTRTAMAYPHNLGEGKHLLTPENELHYLLGMCLRAAGDESGASEWLERAAGPQGDPAAPAADGPYWQALALSALGRDEAARACAAGGALAGRRPGGPEPRSRSPTSLRRFRPCCSSTTTSASAHDQEASYLEGWRCWDRAIAQRRDEPLGTARGASGPPRRSATPPRHRARDGSAGLVVIGDGPGARGHGPGRLSFETDPVVRGHGRAAASERKIDAHRDHRWRLRFIHDRGAGRGIDRRQRRGPTVPQRGRCHRCGA